MALLRIVVGLLVAAHGLVHLLYFADDVDEFSLEKSWLLPAGSRRPVGVALIALTVAAFLLLALAVWGVPGLSDAWPMVAIAAAVVSAVLLVGYWTWSLSFGLLIDLALVAVAATRPVWADDLFGAG